MMQLDLCPKCGSEGVFGLRSHPKFATCYAGVVDGDLDMVMAYFHTQEHNDAFASSGIDLLYKQRWNGTAWEEYV